MKPTKPSLPSLSVPFAALLAGTLGAAALTTPAFAEPADLASDLAGLVDPFIGTGSGGPVVGEVDTFPGASAPFGMIQWSPDTPRRPAGGGYWYDDTTITGFSLTHLSGVGCAITGDIPFLPLAGALPANPGDASAPFSHADETAAPGSYAVTAGGVRTELTTTTRTGLARLTYPATDQAQLLVKVAGSQNGSANATFGTVGTDEIAGSVTSGRFCNQPNSYTVYFAAKFDRPFTASGTWGGTTATAQDSKPGTPASRRTALAAPQPVSGGYVTFDTRRDPTVRVKVAISYVGLDAARANLRAEARTWDLDAQKARARAGWNRQLRKIRITGGTPDQRKQFYTALYHALLHPSVFSDADGRYMGFDNKVHRVRGTQYANFSGWDIYRSQIPLLAMIAPDETSDMMASLLRDADESGGWLPKWPVANGHTSVMNGDAADPMLASAYAFGARRFDVRHAVDVMVHGAEGTGPPGQGFYVERPTGPAYIATGYVPNTQATDISPKPNGASETLEYALADFAISRLATSTGRRDVATRFHQRSQNWANLFDTATGYIRPRDGDGAFPPGDPTSTGGGFGQSGFQEGNAAQYTFMVPQNLGALVDGLGGPEAAQRWLDAYFTKLNVGPNEPFHWQGNEPTFGTPWAYDSAGAPWKTQATVRRIMTELYKPAPGGEPGNDDLGALSSWYVWAAIGLYPQTPGVPLLVTGSPLFRHVTIDAGDDRRIDIDAPAAATDHPYVTALKVNGRATTKPWIMLGERDMRLDFTLSDTPDKTWGAAKADAPPSYPAGPVTFPPTTRAAITADPAQVRLAPGEPAAVDVVVDNTLGRDPATVTWQAQSSPGLTFTPATGTVAVAAAGSARMKTTVSAGADARSGFYQVSITAKAANGAVLQRTHVLVTVARPGEIIPTAYVSNYSDGTITPVDTRTRTAGPTIAVGAGPDGVQVTPGNKEVYVANNNTNNVTVIDPATNRVTATVPVGSIAADVAVTPDGATVWVSNYGDGTVQPIDTATHTAGTPIRVGGNPQRLRVSPDGRQLWVPNQGSGTVSVIDLATRTVTATVPVGAAPFGLAISPDSKTAYVGNTGGNSLSVISTATATVTATIPLGSSPAGLAVSPDGRVLYATVGTGGVLPVDTATGTVGPLIATGAGPYDVEFTADGATAWVVDSNTNDVRAVDVATAHPTDAITVGNVPDGVGLTR